MKRWHIIGSVLLVCCVVFWVYRESSLKSSYLVVTMLDVGQGDAILISDPAGYQVVIDGGPTDSVVGELQSVMPLLDDTIDAVMLSHPDADHVAGMSAILDSYRVTTIIDNNIPKDSEVAERFRRLSREEPGAIIESMFRGDVLRFPSGAFITVLAPEKDFQTTETNDYSIIAKLQYGDISFLFTGDAASVVESRLIETSPEDLHSNVLKIPHHGSRFSSSSSFLRYVDPEFAIVSYACKNTYGHPNPATVARYSYFHIPVYSTCDRGTFTVQTDGKTAWLKGSK